MNALMKTVSGFAALILGSSEPAKAQSNIAAEKTSPAIERGVEGEITVTRSPGVLLAEQNFISHVLPTIANDPAKRAAMVPIAIAKGLGKQLTNLNVVIDNVTNADTSSVRDLRELQTRLASTHRELVNFTDVAPGQKPAAQDLQLALCTATDYTAYCIDSLSQQAASESGAIAPGNFVNSVSLRLDEHDKDLLRQIGTLSVTFGGEVQEFTNTQSLKALELFNYSKGLV